MTDRVAAAPVSTPPVAAAGASIPPSGEPGSAGKGRWLIAGAVVALVLAAVFAFSGGSGDDSIVDSTPPVPGETAPTGHVDVEPSATGVATVPPESACADVLYVTTDDGMLVELDARTEAVVETIAVGGDALGLAVTPSGTKAYVANHDGGTVTVVDLVTGVAVATIALTNSARFDDIIESHEPVAVAVTPDGSKVYVVSYYGSTTFRGGLWVIDTATDTLVAQVDLNGRPLRVVVSPDGSTAYVTAPEAAVFVVDTASDSVVATIDLDGRPDGIDLSPDGATAYVADRVGASIWVIDTATRSVRDTVAVGEYPVGVAVAPDGTSIYVSSEYGASVVVIDAASEVVTATIDVDEDLSYLAVAPSGAAVYAVDFVGSVWPIDLATNTLSAPIDLGGWGRGIASCTGAT